MYLTDSVNTAIMWANKNHLVENNPRESCFVVFECRIDENELLPDIDELKIAAQYTKLEDIDEITALESLQICHAARISRDLVIGTDIVRYMELPNANYFEHPLLHVTKACVRVRTNIDCSEEFIWKQSGC